MINLAIGKAALQSSFSEYSSPDDPLRAVSGAPTGAFSFHTDIETDPWWLLDLGSLCRVRKIVVYNRGDGAQHRARHFRIEIFDPAVGGWRLVYAAENEFGGVGDNCPLTLNFGTKPKLARYIKFSIKSHNYLHLDQVEVFGTPEQTNYARLEAMLPEPKVAVAHESRGLGAIVGLVRGYDDVEGYDALIARNAAIFEAINKRRSLHYPLVIWHEGNISADHQAYILSKEQNGDVTFVDISNRFRLPPDLAVDDLQEGWSIGYRLMCMFNTFDIWELTEGFDYILRIDEDCLLSRVIDDPFVWMRDANLDCAFSWLIDDNHDLTNDTLPAFVEAFVVANGIANKSPIPLTSCFPYTNVMMARTAFFRRRDVQHFLSVAVRRHEFFINRWGDHIVLGVPLNLHSSIERIQPIAELSYVHHSHHVTVVANDDHRTRAWSRSNPDRANLVEELPAEDCERALLALYADWPISRRSRQRLVEHFEASQRHAIADRLRSPQTVRDVTG